MNCNQFIEAYRKIGSCVVEQEQESEIEQRTARET